MLILCLESPAQRRGGFIWRPPPVSPRVPVPSIPSHGVRPANGKASRFRGTGQNSIIAYPIPYPVYVGGDDASDDSQSGAESESPETPDPRQFLPLLPPRQIPLAVRTDAQPEPSATTTPPPATQGCPATDNNVDRVQFFIVLKDHWVHVAVAYWVENGTVHYITPEGSHNQVSIGLVDRQVSAKLNAGNAVKFVLPGK